MLTRKNRYRHLTLLDSFQVDDILHLGRPLREHLVGTYDLLAQWDSPVDVRLAGLFHSIYGTQTFHSAAVTTGSRNAIRALIGDYAEHLVFVFGMSDRQQLLLNNTSAPYAWTDRQSGTKNALADVAYRHLIEMEVANFIEQMPFLVEHPPGVLREMKRRFDAAAQHMSVNASAAYRRAICTGAQKSRVSAGPRPE